MRRSLRVALPFLVGTAVIYALWICVMVIVRPAEYILPSPISVFSRLFTLKSEMLRHTGVTCLESGVGFSIGLVFSCILACLTVASRKLDAIISPLVVIMQSIPKIGLAPLFVIWFGYGYGPKIAIAALVSFFPVLVNLVGGMKAVNPEYLDYAATLKMRTLGVIFHVRLPFAMPYFFAAMKMAVIYCFVGAVVGEFVGADAGLGYLIIQGDLSFDTALLFAAIHILAGIGVVLYLAVSLMETWFLRWMGDGNENMGFVVTA
jgi:NitT/TauT family transport system permease protein